MLLSKTSFRLAAALLAAVVALPAGGASAAPPSNPPRYALPMPAITAPAEPYGAYQAQTICTSGATPGVLAFQKLVMTRYVGSRNLGITRGCGSGGRSEHKEGRAWDWGVRLDRPTEKAYADDVIGWLLAPDAAGVRAANARRLGIMYIIWNRKIWTASRAADGWRAYFGPNPHFDHVHFSWTWPGAQKLTSYWTGTPYGIGAAGGQLDSLWGTGGWLPTQTGESLRLIDSLRWPDGRFWNVSQSMVSAEVVIEERLPNGTLGSAFGGSGRTRVLLPPSTTVTSSLLTPAGNVVVAGATTPAVTDPAVVPTQDLFAMQITTAGVADASFGLGGAVIWNLGGDDVAKTLAAAGSDIVLGGTSTIAGAPAMAIARLTGAGGPAAFGTNGALVAIGSGMVSADSLLPRPDGTIVVGCRTPDTACTTKLTPTGSFDQTWGLGAYSALGVGPSTTVLAPGPNGTVYAAFAQANGYAGIYRLNSAGVGDPTFGTAPYWAQQFGITGCTNRPTSIVVRSDGTPLIAGHLDGCGRGFVARLTIDGPLDPTWGNAGVATFDSVGGTPIARVGSVSLQADGHVVVAASGGTDPAVAPSLGRFTTSGPVPARTVALRSTALAPHGSAVQLTAVVRSTNTYGLATGVPVTFERLTAGAATWEPLGAVASTSGGVATLRLQPVAHAMYRVRSGATDQLSGATSSPIAVRIGFAITPTTRGPAAPAKLYPRQAVTLSLLAKPGRPGRRVWLQRFDRGRWRTIATPVLNARSMAGFRVASPIATTGLFRWVIFGDAQYDGATTSTIAVVWHARPLPPKPKPPTTSPKPPVGTPAPLPPNAPGAPAAPAPAAPAPAAPAPAAPANPVAATG